MEIKGISKDKAVADDLLQKLGVYELMGPNWNNVRESVCGPLKDICKFVEGTATDHSQFNNHTV